MLGMLGPTTWDVGMADPKKHTPPNTIPNLVALGRTVWVYVADPSKFGTPRPTP